MTITPTVFANLKDDLEMYSAKRDAESMILGLNKQVHTYVERSKLDSSVKKFNRAPIILTRGLNTHGSLDAFDDHLDECIRNLDTLADLSERVPFHVYSSKIAVIEYRISNIPNLVRKFEEEHGEFDDAMFTLWYQR